METKKNPTIDIKFEKAPTYRVYYVDGAWGGLSPRGKVNVDFFVDKMDLPEKVKYTTRTDGKLGEIKERIPNDVDYVREMQFGIMLDIPVAEALKDWLEKKIKEHHLVFDNKNKTEVK